MFEEGDTPSVILTVSPESYPFPASGGSTTITVTSNVSWSVTSSAAWLTPSPTNGSNNGTFTITAAENTGASRNATVTVSGGGVLRQIDVTQDGIVSNPSLSVSPESYPFPASSGSTTITVTSNVSWAVTSNSSWLTASPTSGSNNGTFTITAAENTGASRNATVTVSGGGVSRQIDVTQDGIVSNPSLTVSPESYPLFPESGDSTTINVTSNVSWTVTSSAAWLTPSPASGSNNGTFIITAAVNTGAARSATVTVSGGGVSRQIDVTQAAGITGIEDALAHQLKIFPNPAQTEITIESGNLAIELVEICDLSGRKILHFPLSIVHSPFSINVSALPQGVYLLKVYTGKDFVVHKFVKE